VTPLNFRPQETNTPFIEHIMKVGSEEMTDLTIINFPACDSMLEVTRSLVSHFFTSGMNACTVGFVVPSGKPK
jgi:hypothetical protein